MKILLPLLNLLLTAFTITAQHFQTVNHFTAGDTQDDAITDIKTDAAGNIYITGHFTGTVDFDPGPGTYNLSTATGHTQPDAFIQKLDASGNLLWAKSFGGNTDGYLSGTRMALDDSGYVYLVGAYQRDIRFTPGGNLWSSGSTNQTRPFAVKLDSQGNVVWGRVWQNSNSNQFFYSQTINVDAESNVYIGGMFQGTVDFNPTMGQDFKSITSDADAYVVKLKYNGDYSKVITFGGAEGSNLVETIEVDYSQNLYIGGFFSDTVDFNPGPGVVKRGSRKFSDSFILKVDTGLNFKWVATFGGTSVNRVVSLKTSQTGYLYSTGTFGMTSNLNPDPNNPFNVTSNGNTDVFVQKLDTAGNFIWGRSFGGVGIERPNKIELDGTGNLAIVGRFRNTVDFNQGGGNPHIITSNGDDDSFVTLLDTAGNFIAASAYGGSDNDNIYGVQFISPNRLYVGGLFRNTININPNATPQLVTSAGGSDMLFMELQLCTSDTNNINVTACGKYTVPSGSATHTASGTYYDTIPDALGCDSILEINLTLLPAMDTSVTLTATTLTANATGVSYQWYDCQTEQIIPGETGQTFEPTSAGQYAVIIDDGTCTDTSSCKTMHNIGLPEYAQIPVKLYPNPTEGLLHIKSPQAWQRAEITDLTGRTLLTSKEPNRPLDLTKLPSGVYLVKVFFENGVSVEKVVKE